MSRFPLECVCTGAGHCEGLGRPVSGTFQSKCSASLEFRKGIVTNEKSAPGIVTKVMHFTGAVIRHIVGGMKAPTKEEFERRKSICMGCEFWIGDICVKCGCAVMAKTAWLREQCPENKW